MLGSNFLFVSILEGYGVFLEKGYLFLENKIFNRKKK